MSGVENVVLEGDKKPVAEITNTINIMVKSNVDQTEVWFRIRRDAQMSKLMNAYGEAKQLDMQTIRFLYDSTRIKPEHTPDELGIEDGAEIDAFLYQFGAGYGRNRQM
ncbi:hypothetical protein C5167_029145 [Papaver somniferum]|uniref:small ubiquitin-related modifier 1-like n=1 Tax=Papaver somniferum TaxID=3469 RepID=UPI000E7010CE|nr:small ubiquitin-related modifier 1-like [Papaver somniferum]RZC93168.1 hypothetical protein C5167_029145 [Papaver somniferum]